MLFIALAVQACTLPNIVRVEAATSVDATDESVVPDGGLRITFPTELTLEQYFVPPVSVPTPATSAPMGGKIVSDLTHLYASAYYPLGPAGATASIFARAKVGGFWTRMTDVVGVAAPAAIAMDRSNQLHHVFVCNANCTIVGVPNRRTATRLQYQRVDAGLVNFDSGTVEFEPSLAALSNVEVTVNSQTNDVFWSYLSDTMDRNRVFAVAPSAARPALIFPQMDAGIVDARVDGGRDSAAAYPATTHTLQTPTGPIHVAAMRGPDGGFQTVELLRRGPSSLERIASIPGTRVVTTPDPDQFIVASVGRSPNGTLFVLVSDGLNEFQIGGFLHRFSADGTPLPGPTSLGRVDKSSQLHVINDQDILVFSGSSLNSGIGVWQSNDGGATFPQNGRRQLPYSAQSMTGVPMETAALTTMSIETPWTSPVGWDPYLVRLVLSLQLRFEGLDSFRGAVYLEIPLGH